MKKAIVSIIAILIFNGTAAAFDIATLDRVSVLMPKSQVISLLGKPDQVDIMRGLKVEVYNVTNLNPMVSTGCIYDGDSLKGQAFVFQGEMTKAAADRMKTLGFVLSEEKEGTYRLLGKDDDTGRPIMVHILPDKGLTVVMIFEKDFYDRQVK